MPADELERFSIMNITEYKKKDGTIVYRTSLYLGIDSITGKKIKTTISARTKKEIKNKALQAKFEFEKSDTKEIFKSCLIQAIQVFEELF